MNNGGYNSNRPHPRVGNMRIPSIEERKKTPYVKPADPEASGEVVAPSPASVTDRSETTITELPDDNVGISSPSMGYYPLAGRKKSSFYTPSASDVEIFSMLALLAAMIIFVIFILCSYGGYVFSDATGIYLHTMAAADGKILSSAAVSPLSESDYFDGGEVIEPVDPDAPYDFTTPVPVSAPADDAYFSDAVFIGDSRTEGLWLYSKLKSSFICERGLNVSKMFSDALDKYDGNTAFEELCETDCGKIYISFGINEIGWVTSAFIKSYGELIDRIKAEKPDAVIYVQNIYPMSKEQHDKAIYGDNTKLHEYNELIAEMCAEKEVYLLDVASYFSDENGHLKDSYETGVDGAHFKAGGQGYVDWTNYIRTHTVQTQP